MGGSVTRRDFIKAWGALIGVTGATALDCRIGVMMRALYDRGSWTLTFDDRELTTLIRRGIHIGGITTDERGRPAVECTLEFETAYLWTLATLTDPSGDEWKSVDGETWTQGERKMML